MREANDQRIRLERSKRLKYDKGNPSSERTNYESEQYEGAQAHRGGLWGCMHPIHTQPKPVHGQKQPEVVFS